MSLDDLLTAAADQVDDGAPVEDAEAAPTAFDPEAVGDHAVGVMANAATVPTDLTLVSEEFIGLMGLAAGLSDLPEAAGSEGTESGDQLKEDINRINRTLLTTVRDDSRQILDTIDQLIIPAMHSYIGVAQEQAAAANAAPLGSPASAALAAVAAARGTTVTGDADQKLAAATQLMEQTYPEDEIAAFEKDTSEGGAEGELPDVGEGLSDKRSDTAAPVDVTSLDPALSGASGYGTSPLLSPGLSSASHTPVTALSSAMPAMASGMAGGFGMGPSPMAMGSPSPYAGGGYMPYSTGGYGGGSPQGAGSAPSSGGRTMPSSLSGGASGLGGSGVTRDELRQMVEDARKRIESERGSSKPSSSDPGDRPRSRPTASPTAPSSPSGPGSGPGGGDRSGAPSSSSGVGSSREHGSPTALRGQTVTGGLVDKALVDGRAGNVPLAPSAASGGSSGGGGSSATGGMRGGMPMGMMPMMGAMGAAARGAGGAGGAGGGVSFDLPEDYRIQEEAENRRGTAVVGGVLRPGSGTGPDDGWVSPTRRADEAQGKPERRTGLFG